MSEVSKHWLNIIDKKLCLVSFMAMTLGKSVNLTSQLKKHNENRVKIDYFNKIFWKFMKKLNGSKIDYLLEIQISGKLDKLSVNLKNGQ
jgi:hypothetical protein